MLKTTEILARSIMVSLDMDLDSPPEISFSKKKQKSFNFDKWFFPFS